MQHRGLLALQALNRDGHDASSLFGSASFHFRNSASKKRGISSASAILSRYSSPMGRVPLHQRVTLDGDTPTCLASQSCLRPCSSRIRLSVSASRP